jgi:thiamine biosynthesis lipoprotein ApbE
VLDPRSGLPLERRRQAMVVAPNAALAEALSKALLILGEKEGVALVAGQPGCEGLLVDADGGSWETPGWRKAVRFEPLPIEGGS